MKRTLKICQGQGFWSLLGSYLDVKVQIVNQIPSNPSRNWKEKGPTNEQSGHRPNVMEE
jgi:hypothetical protein